MMTVRELQKERLYEKTLNRLNGAKTFQKRIFMIKGPETSLRFSTTGYNFQFSRKTPRARLVVLRKFPRCALSLELKGRLYIWRSRGSNQVA